MLAASPLLSGADIPPNPLGPRISAFDGLRGFLALAVFFHHGVTYHDYISVGLWRIPPSETFYLLVGKFGVAGFFMITGYLFWSRIINPKQKLNWYQLYIGRIFRIGPLYIVSSLIMLLIVLKDSEFKINTSYFSLAKQTIRWFSLGFLKGYDFNGSTEPSILLGVAWTLQFEWYFYISLPILSAILIKRNNINSILFLALIAYLFYISTKTSASLFYGGLTYVEPTALFLVGMICASAPYREIVAKIPQSLTSLIFGILIISAFLASNIIHSAGEIILLGSAFYLITEGCSFYGLLVSRPALRLGNISYGIYLLQNLIFSTVFSIGWARSIALSSPFGHWAITVLCAALLIVTATAAHLWIERPGIELGKRAWLVLKPGFGQVKPRVPGQRL